MQTIRCVFLALALLLVSSCVPLFDGDHWIEVARTPSPDGRLDAILVEDGGDATTGVFHDVFVVPHGAPVPHSRQEIVAVFEWAFRNDSALGVNPHWRSRRVLALEYARASHQNIWRATVPFEDECVTVVLARGVVDPTAPAGRMVRTRSK